MKKVKLTNEEKEAIKVYKGFNYEAINQLLTADAETDVALLSSHVESFIVPISYEKDDVIKNLIVISKIYSAMLKQNRSVAAEIFVRGSNIEEINRMKNETYVDRIISVTKDKNKAFEYANNWRNPVVLNVIIDQKIPFISLDGLAEDSEKEYLISPYTKIKSLEEISSTKFGEKEVKEYNLYLEPQEMHELSEEETESLYEYIIKNIETINERLESIVDFDNSNNEKYEKIRKLEKDLAKCQEIIDKREQEGDYNESARKADEKDLITVEEKLNLEKEELANLFEKRKEDINFITNWKKNVSVYCMSKCAEIENEDKSVIEDLGFKIDDRSLQDVSLENLKEVIKKEFNENRRIVEILKNDIKNLMNNEQNYAKIASKLDSEYSAINNAYAMKEAVEKLWREMANLEKNINEICEAKEDDDAKENNENLIKYSKVINQIGVLVKYINNPKYSKKDESLTRFEEMTIMEENELKRGIANKILKLKAIAEMKKLEDERELLEDRSLISRVIGFFTGKNKLNEIKEEQVDIKEKEIRKALSIKLKPYKNYSMHQLMADIDIFINGNTYYIDLIPEEIEELEKLKERLKEHFVIYEEKVKDIIYEREKSNLPVDTRKMNKRELLENETYRFLNKYGYDIKVEQDDNAVEYKDTVAAEINRIIEYIDISK